MTEEPACVKPADRIPQHSWIFNDVTVGYDIYRCVKCNYYVCQIPSRRKWPSSPWWARYEGNKDLKALLEEVDVAHVLEG
jgi:hypothetical protein